MRRFLLVLSFICYFTNIIWSENIRVPIYDAFTQGFESNTDGWLTIIGSSNYGTIAQVPSGTDGITSKSGSYHAKVGHNASGPFSRFDKYRSVWPIGGWKASLDIYLDPNWATSRGFDLSVASSKQSGQHLRDFIFHVCKDQSTGNLLVGGSNNSNNSVRQDLESINHYTITTAGWYSFEFHFKNVAGALSVDLNLRDAGGSLLWTETRTDALDLISTVVGGNRYMWFTFISIPGDLHIDNTSLTIYHNTIQSAVNSSANGDIILVDDGTYNENVLINKNITLKSVNGYNSTSIIGSAGSNLGTIQITTGSNGVQIGGIEQGFSITGIDGTAGLEKAAIYFQGAHNNASVIGNEVIANGDAGLMCEWNAAVTNMVVDNNYFSGKTFNGINPKGDGFDAQFTLLDVPRQLVVLSGGKDVTNIQNIIFTNNVIDGVSGGCSNTDNSGNIVSWHQQGNTQVTIDAVGATITGNTFSGITTRYAEALRTRGTGTHTITGNIFNGFNPAYFTADTKIPADGTARAAAVFSSNTFADASTTLLNNAIYPPSYANNPLNCDCQNAAVDDDWAGYTPGTFVYAQSQAWIFGTNAFATIQEGINAVCGSTVYVAAGTYNENVNITKSITLKGAGYNNTIIKGLKTASPTVKISSNNIVVEGFHITRDGNNTTDWVSNSNMGGLTVQGAGKNAIVRNNKFTGNRTAIDINDAQGNHILNNIIEMNRSGILFRNVCENNIVQYNSIVNNSTIGVLWLNGSPNGANGTKINYNIIMDNWFAQIESRIDALTTPIDFKYNYYGVCQPIIDTRLFGYTPDEPSYASQIPTWFGGTSIDPNSYHGVIKGVTATMDYTPWLGSNSFGDPALWLSSITAKRHGDERLSKWLSMDCGNREAVQNAPNRQPIYDDGWVKFESDFGPNKYGFSDIMEIQRYDDITATDGGIIDKWHPSPKKKNLFVTFKTGSSVDNEAEPPVYYRDGRQCIFEAGGPLSGYNLYIVEGKLVFGMWNRFESKFTILENSTLYPLSIEKVYYGHLNYDGANFQATVSDGLDISPSPSISFAGISQDNEDKTGIGGAARTRYHDYSVGSTYSDEFDGLLGDIIIYSGNFSGSSDINSYLFGRYGFPSGTSPRISAGDWKIIAEYDRTGENAISSAYPNPFDSKTSIGLNLLSEQNINVELLDLMGRKVANVFKGKLAAGIHDIEIDGTGLTNGIYFIKVAGETFTQTTQVILNK